MSIQDKGVVLYIVYQKHMILRYKSNQNVYVPWSLFSLKGVPEKDDIYSFKASEINYSRNPELKSEKLQPDVKYKAESVKFVKKPRVISGDGKFIKLDQKGEFGFISHKTSDGQEINIFCTRVTVKPECNSMAEMFAYGAPVRFTAKEQPPSGREGVEWRTVVATDMSHQITEAHEVVRMEKKPTRAVVQQTTKAAPAVATSPARVSRRVSPPPSYSSAATASHSVQDAAMAASSAAVNEHPIADSAWRSYVADDSSMEQFEAELNKLRLIAHCLYNGDCNACLSH